MPRQITGASTVYVLTEDDILSNGKDGASLNNASGTIVRSPDLGTNASAMVANPTANGDAIALLKGILNSQSLRVPQTQTLTFTIANGANTSNFVQLIGRVSAVFINSTVLGATLQVRQRLVNGTGTGFVISDADAVDRVVVLDGAARVIDGESMGWLAGAIGSEIALQTNINQTSEQIITVKVLV
jgi:hypothetical protein